MGICAFCLKTSPVSRSSVALALPLTAFESKLTAGDAWNLDAKIRGQSDLHPSGLKPVSVERTIGRFHSQR